MALLQEHRGADAHKGKSTRLKPEPEPEPEPEDRSFCSYLGEALRALLVLEVRQLCLAGRHPCERTPAHLPEGATAARCSVRTASGATATVVLGGPPNGVLPH